ncbi:MAG: AraC family transcriptional regulator [Ruminococcus sp.]|nr:AraC family transcriptional regulator [Ruminococcus sp.]
MDTLKEFNTGDIYIRHAVDLHPDGRSFEFHVHDRCEIYYFIDGSAEYLVEGSVYALERGSLLIMRPGEAHRVRIVSEERYERYAVNFPLSVFDSFDPRRTLMIPFTDRPLGKGNCFSLPGQEGAFEEMCRDDLDVYGRRVTAVTKLMMLTDLIGACSRRELPSYGGADTVEKKMVAYVNEHLFDEFTVESLAEHFFLSRSQLCRTFKRATGASPWDYILAKRLLAAKQMIDNGSTARHAAESCGFGDYSGFYRAFVKRFGHSPKGVR